MHDPLLFHPCAVVIYGFNRSERSNFTTGDAPMNVANKHIRHGKGTVRPFLYGRLDLLDFVKNVFGGVELERNVMPGGFHVETQIGDAVVVMAAMEPPYPDATLASVYVYVDNVDAVYARAIAAGAQAPCEP